MTREIIAVTKNSLHFNIEAFTNKQHSSGLGVGDGCRSSAIAILAFLKQVKRLPSGQSLIGGSIARCARCESAWNSVRVRPPKCCSVTHRFSVTTFQWVTSFSSLSMVNATFRVPIVLERAKKLLEGGESNSSCFSHQFACDFGLVWLFLYVILVVALKNPKLQTISVR